MKIRALFIALASLLSLASPTLHAGTPVPLTYNNGDLFLGFRATGSPGSTQDYLVNIGQVSTFTSATSAFNVSGLGDILTDLNFVFGNNWKTRADVFWSVSGAVGNFAAVGNDPAKTIYATVAEETVGTLSANPWIRASSSAQNGTTNKMASMAQSFVFTAGVPNDSTGNSPVGLIQNSTDTNNYASYQRGGTTANSGPAPGISFAAYNPSIEGDFTNGTAGSALDLVRLVPAPTGQTGLVGTIVGTFTISDLGVLRFTPAPAAPTTSVKFEMSSYSVSEADVSGQLAVKIVRTGDQTTAFTVNFSTTDGTGPLGAVAGTDFTGQMNAAVSFAANQTDATAMVTIANRTGYHGDRTFSLGLSGATNGVSIISPSTAGVTITESDPVPSDIFTFSSNSISVVSTTGGSPSQIQVAINRSANTTSTATVDVNVSGTLTNGTDYQMLATPTTISFAAGDTVKVLNIQLNAIASGSLPGTILLALGNPTGGATIGTPGSTTITVNAADTTVPTLTLTTPTAGTVGSTFDVAGTVGDNVGIDRVVVTINGVAQNATLGTFASGSASFTLNGVLAENGNNSLIVQAFDTNGNASSPLTRSVTYTNTRPAFAGAYNGLLLPAVAPSNDRTGLVTLTVMNTGSFTGRVTIGNSQVNIGGIFGNDGTARFNPTLAKTLALVGTGSVQLGNLDLTITTDKVTGHLVDGTSTTIAAVDTDRKFFDGKTPATTVNGKYLKNNGVFTVILPARPMQSGMVASDYPQGDGFGTLTLTNKGAATFAGKLADGTVVNTSGLLSKDYRLPFYVAAYGNLGSVAGFVQFDRTQSDSDFKGLGLQWFRPAMSGATMYPSGWSGGIALDLLGARYAIPALGTKSVFPGVTVTKAGGNAKVEFSDGQLAAMISKSVNIKKDNSVTNVPSSDTSFKLKIKAGSGKVKGTFLHSDGSTPAFEGRIFQKGATKGAYGYFLSTQGATGTVESGGVSVTPK